MNIIDDEDEKFFKEALPLQNILTNETLCKYFYDFSKKERNVEALDFYLQVVNYQKLKTKEERQEEHKAMYNKYLDVNSPQSINISLENVESINSRSEEAPADLYNNLQKEMEGLLMDPYRRFFKTSSYEEMMTNLQIDKKIKVNFDHEEDDSVYQLASPGIGLFFFDFKKKL
jgi:hypothetical protein